MRMVNDELVVIPGSEILGTDRTQIMLPFSKDSDHPEGPTKFLIGQFTNGFYTWDGDQFEPFPFHSDEIDVNSFYYRGIKSKSGNFVLSAVGTGLIVLSEEGEVLQIINRTTGLEDATVYGIYEDSKGAIWLGLDNGIARIETNSPFSFFGKADGISSSALAVERSNGTLYLGTTNGVLKFNQNRNAFEVLPGGRNNATQIFDLASELNTLIIPSSNGMFYSTGLSQIPLITSQNNDISLSRIKRSKETYQSIIWWCPGWTFYF